MYVQYETVIKTNEQSSVVGGLTTWKIVLVCASTTEETCHCILYVVHFVKLLTVDCISESIMFSGEGCRTCPSPFWNCVRLYGIEKREVEG